MTSHSTQCTCFACVSAGPTRCSSSCVLRHGHAGPHAGWLAFARMFVGELRRRVGKKIAGNT